MSEAYRRAGVDLNAKERLVSLLQAAGESATRPEVLDGIGGFGGLFRLAGFRQPVLVAGADGVGTKLMLARSAGDLSGVGQDVVAMVANDVLCHGAQMLFFLDYVGVSHLDPQEVSTVVRGVAAACREIGAALLGGETAELPDLFAPGELDLVGFGVGAVEEERKLTGHSALPGDILVGLSSSGFHSNGFSLVRQILKEQGLSISSEHGLGAPLAELLLRPTRLYGPVLAAEIEAGRIRALSHITGGGLPGNLPRMLAPGAGANLDKTSWQVPEVMGWLIERAALGLEEAAEVFNLGLGMVVAVAPEDVDTVCEGLRRSGESPLIVGEVVEGEGVTL